MIFTARIKTITDLIGHCKSVIDIGCDHGYLGVNLFKKHYTQRVTFVDTSEQAILTSQQNIQNQVPDQFSACEFYISDGFQKIDPTNHYDTLVIAGMGTFKIIEILTSMKNPIDFGVFGPQNNAPTLRKFFNDKKIKIIDEALVFDRGFFYEFIKVDFNEKITKTYSELEELIGPILIQKHEPIIKQYWQERYEFLISLPHHQNMQEINLIKEFLQLS